MSFAPMVKVEGKFCPNGLRFATYEEAFEYAKDLFYRWTATSDYRADESTDPVNARFFNNAVEYLDA